MSFNLVTGRKASDHVTSTQFRDIMRSIFGKDTYIPDVNENLAIEQTTSNTITVSSGVLVHHGCIFEIPYGDSVTLTIDTPTAGVNKQYKICVEWSISDGIESAELKVVSASASGLNTGNMQEGDTRDNVVIADVTVSGLTVTITPVDFKGSVFHYGGSKTITLTEVIGAGGESEVLSGEYFTLRPGHLYLFNVYMEIQESQGGGAGPTPHTAGVPVVYYSIRDVSHSKNVFFNVMYGPNANQIEEYATVVDTTGDTYDRTVYLRMVSGAGNTYYGLEPTMKASCYELF